MGDKSSIEWTDATWNPVVGCTQISPGCDNCYALTLHNRRHQAWQGGTFPDAAAQYHVPFETVQLKPERLTLPLRWRRPRRIFVNSLSDLFHDDVPTEFIDRVFGVMTLAGRHTFQVLTKRPKRMREYASDPETPKRIGLYMNMPTILFTPGRMDADGGEMARWHTNGVPWPLPNVWLGVSVELDRYAWRARTLAETPAAVRFVSAEPLLGPLPSLFEGYQWARGALRSDYRPPFDWLIAGGESGGALERRLISSSDQSLGWVRDLRDRCTAAGVVFHFKQWGGARPTSGGRLLDGRTWDEFPVAREAVTA